MAAHASSSSAPAILGEVKPVALPRAELVLQHRDFKWITDKICGIVEGPTPAWWWYCFAVAIFVASFTVAGLTYLVGTGVGVWGHANPVNWAWDIVNFVFWIGIGHAGTLISAILCLLRQKWRTSINRAAEALPQIEALLAEAPGDMGYRNLHAAALSLVGEYAKAIAIYEDGLAIAPEQPLIWLSYGHALRTSGRQTEAIAAYKRALDQMPGLGEAYFSLSNLKTVRFSPDEVAAMRAQLERDDLTVQDQFHLHYALGKALEDEGDYAASFDHYAKGAALRRSESLYDAEENTARAERSRAVFTPDFFKARDGWGCDAPDPIFVVGLPRSGSTLIEQILASHSAVEGTMELPDINVIAMTLGHSAPTKVTQTYPASIAALDSDQLAALGEDYLRRTRIQRKTDRPLFIDKMPNNFQHVGLIHLILPRAKIIDARRYPMATCFSAFKQHFARGQNFSYDLDELGRYYRDYVALMAHFDLCLPGRVHRVLYERMVDDPEAEVRALLDYCGLPFEDACLRFYENDRAVRTASSEQVRQPIFRDGLDQWRRYEPWLDPLKAALGPVLDAYPTAPET